MSSRPVSVEISETLIKEFLENQPSFYSEEKLILAFIQCTVETLIHLQEHNSQIAEKYISSCISLCSELLVIGRSNKLTAFSAKTIHLIILKTITPNLWKKRNNLENLLDFESVSLEKTEKTSQMPSSFSKIVSILKYLLSSRFENVYEEVFIIIENFFKQLNPSCPIEKVQNLIEEFVELRLNNNNNNVNFSKAFGSALRNLGVEKILEIFEMKIPNMNPLDVEFENVGNLWILEMINKWVKEEDFHVFLEKILPLLNNCQMKLKSETNNFHKKMYENLIAQIWQCFSGFYKINKSKKFTELSNLIVFVENEIYSKDLRF